MNRNPARYFGMTIAQLGILSCLAVLACGATGTVLWLMAAPGLTISNLFGNPGASNVPTAALPTWIPTATAAPIETPTLIPYDALVPAGWKQFKGKGVEVWLPSSFVGQNVDQFIKDAIAKAEKLGFSVDSESQQDVTYVLAAKESQASQYLYYTNLIIAFTPLPSNGVEAYLKENLAKAPPQVVVVEHKQVRIGNYDGWRLVEEVNLNNMRLAQVDYLIQDGDRLWDLGYATHQNELYERLPTFDQSAQTFRVTR
jgi:hypothetical protein